MLKPVVFVVGPTGSGKSKLALTLARKLKAEIVSADSMQIYRGMNIGTAKQTKKEQRLVPHHLLDAITSRSECSVYRYCQLAFGAIEKILKKKRIPMIVGGSGFYIKALIDGLSPLPGKHPKLRNELMQIDSAELYDRLKRLDSDLAKKIHANDKKRIMRAIEIIEARRGLSIGAKQKMKGLLQYGLKPIVFGLERDRKELYERIERRADQMFAAGWVNEVRRLKRIGFSKTARYAIGYKEILDYLERKVSVDEMIPEIKKRTRHLAKRQMTWFRKDKRIKWFFVRGEKYDPIVNNILKSFRTSLQGGRRPTKQCRSEIASLTSPDRPSSTGEPSGRPLLSQPAFARNDGGN